MSSRNVAAAACAVLASLVLAACGPGGTADAPSAGGAEQPAAPATPAGWERHEQTQARFSVALPASWLMVDPGVVSGGALDEMAAANPELEGLVREVGQAIASGAIALFALDTESAGSGFATNLNVLESGARFGSAEQAAEMAVAEVEAMIPVEGAIDVQHRALPGGDAVRLAYRWTMNNPNGDALQLDATQYLVMADGRAYVMSFTTTAAASPSYGGTFDSIAETFHTLP